MNLESKHINAILRVEHLRKELLGDPITERDCRNFNNLSDEQKVIITAQVMYVMKDGFADHIITYTNPIDQYIDPIKIYGEKGIYLVYEVESEDYTFFKNKQKAFAYANEVYENWLELQSDYGL